jgi:DNA-binding HxlR family transcriptional regulator
VRELLVGTKRFGEFQRALSQISPALLTKRLTQLVDCGLIVKKTTAGQAHAEYHLTAAGQELHEVVFGLGAWGMKWARGQMRDDELDVEMLMYEFCRRLDVTKVPGGEIVVGFTFSRLAKFPHWWIVIEPNRERELCVDHPGREVDVQVRSDARTMAEIWAGDTTVRSAQKEGRLQLSGNPALVRTFSTWLRPGMLAHIRPSSHPLKV